MTPADHLLVGGGARRRRIHEIHGNGIDGVEVRDTGRRLIVFFLAHAPTGVRPSNVRIDPPPGGRPVTVVGVRRAVEQDPELEDRLVIDLHRPGSAGPYRLRLVEPAADGAPGRAAYHGLDARFAQATFVFDVDAPSPPIARHPPGAPRPAHDVSYLARDYEGLRQLMLDRLAVTLPDWSERHVPDLLITLIELFAYVGDDLSYYEDAVATEAYLQTARRRVSVRRHARLTGYRLLEGCHARAWVCVHVSEPMVLPLERVRFATAGSRLLARAPVIDAARESAAALGQLQQYTPLPARLASPAVRNPTLRPEHNAIDLWSWGEIDARLLAGATSAVLVDGDPAPAPGRTSRRKLRLGPGEVLVLEEASDPAIAGQEPPDPTHRQAVRLTHVRELVDELYGQPLLEVSWAHEDALSFDLLLSVGGLPRSLASANAVLVGHGVAASERLDPVAPRLARVGLSFSAPFPDPGVVARHQARRLRSLYRVWREEIETWRREALRGAPLTKARLGALREQLGEEELELLGLPAPDRYGDEDDDDRAEREARGLAELLARSDRLLAGRRRRLEVLARLAEASGPLGEVMVAELEDDWGAEAVRPLMAGSPAVWGPAAAATNQDPRAALPLVEATDGAATGHRWRPAVDLIGVDPAERALVAEVDDDRVARLRISAPPPDGQLEASYWAGNGPGGNTEAEAINAVVWLPSAGDDLATLAPIVRVRNPLPARGGIEAEDPVLAKQRIPGAFADHQPRALSADDYAALGAALPGVRRAAARLRFTGSRTVVEVAVQPSRGEDPHPNLLESVDHALESVRRIGHLVRVRPPAYRPAVLAADVTLTPDTVRAQAGAALAALFSSGWLPDGTPALFNPERLAFGAPVYASALVAALHAAPGVRSAVLTRFAFLDAPPPTAGANRRASRVPDALRVGALELLRLDNDPTRPENGFATVSLQGGR